MIIYKGTVDSFSRDVDTNAIHEIMRDSLLARLNWKAKHSEQMAWKNSLVAMDQVLTKGSKIPGDAGVAIECFIPQSSKRMDFLISGKDENKMENLFIVELKQWEYAEKTMKDGVVKTRFGGNIVETTHPSYQVWSYFSLLRSFNEYAYSSDLFIQPCAYLHN
ncbi:MAG: hypothetical protein MH321_07085 [Leptospiraceae bacterium]|nr:hypothetical protein [Leptospiraceae bacterium]